MLEDELYMNFAKPWSQKRFENTVKTRCVFSEIKV